MNRFKSYAAEVLMVSVLIVASVSCEDQGKRFSYGQTKSGAFSQEVEKDFSDLLKKYVNSQSLIRYTIWLRSDEDLQKLKSILIAIAETDDTALTEDEKKTFYINAYNALTLDLILSHYDDTLGNASSPHPNKRSILNISNLGSKVWDEFHWTIAGKNRTLNDVEHKVLRPMGDARIHLAIVCASKGCPPLSPEVFSATTLNASLDQLADRFVNSGRDTTFNKATREIATSQILSWFGGDFDKHFGSVRNFFSHYVKVLKPEEISDFTINYVDYDWTLNEAPSGSGTEISEWNQ